MDSALVFVTQDTISQVKVVFKVHPVLPTVPVKLMDHASVMWV
jgi:hypothetical protein